MCAHMKVTVVANYIKKNLKINKNIFIDDDWFLEHAHTHTHTHTHTEIQTHKPLCCILHTCKGGLGDGWWRVAHGWSPVTGETNTQIETFPPQSGMCFKTLYVILIYYLSTGAPLLQTIASVVVVLNLNSRGRAKPDCEWALDAVMLQSLVQRNILVIKCSNIVICWHVDCCCLYCSHSSHYDRFPKLGNLLVGCSVLL